MGFLRADQSNDIEKALGLRSFESCRGGFTQCLKLKALLFGFFYACSSALVV